MEEMQENKAINIGYNVSLAVMTATAAIAATTSGMSSVEGVITSVMGAGILILAGVSSVRDRSYFWQS